MRTRLLFNLVEPIGMLLVWLGVFWYMTQMQRRIDRVQTHLTTNSETLQKLRRPQ